MKNRSEEGEKKRTGSLMRIMGAAGAALWVLLILLCLLNRDRITVEKIVGYTPENPVAAALLMLLLFCLKSVSLVFSLDLLYAASGVLFPLPAALVLNLCGTVLTVTIPYLLGRKIGSGAARVEYAQYLPASLLGLVTHIVTFPVLGTSIAEPLSPPFLAAFGIQVTVTAASAVFAAVYRRRHKEKSGKEDRT